MRSGGRTSRISSTFASTRTRTRSRSSWRCCSIAASARIRRRSHRSTSSCSPRAAPPRRPTSSRRSGSTSARPTPGARRLQSWTHCARKPRRSGDTGRAVASARARPAPPAALPRLRGGGNLALRACCARLPPLDAAALRALRRADRVARRALPRMRGPEARVHDRAGGRRVRRRRAPDRRAAGRSAACAGSAADAAGIVAERLPRADVDLVTFVPPDAERRLERGYHPAEQLARALADALAPAVRAAAHAGRPIEPPARALAPRAAPKRRPRLRRAALRRCGSPRRRRLYDRAPRRTPPACGAAHASRGRDVRPRDSGAATRVGVSVTAPSLRRQDAASGQGQEPRGERLDPRLRRAKAGQAREDAARRTTRVEVELAVERNPSVAENQVAEATVWLKGHTLRAREATRDMKASIDELTEKLAAPGARGARQEA